MKHKYKLRQTVWFIHNNVILSGVVCAVKVENWFDVLNLEFTRVQYNIQVERDTISSVEEKRVFKSKAAIVA